MNIELSFEWTYGEFRKMQPDYIRAVKSYPRVHKSRHAFSPRIQRGTILVAVGILTVLAFLQVATWFENGATTIAVGGVVCLPFVLVCWGFPGSADRYKEAWENNTDWRECQIYSITDLKIVRTTSGTRFENEWAVLTHSYETSHFFFLFRSITPVVIIPKTAFTKKAELESFAQRCVAIRRPRVSGFPVER